MNPDLAADVRVRLVERGASPGWEPDRMRAEIRACLRELAPSMPADDATEIGQALFDAFVGLGPLESLMSDPAVTEVMVNGTRGCFVERNGRIERVASPPRPEEVRRAVERAIAPLGLQLDRAHPIVDARLPDGSRLHAVIPPLALDGPVLALRRFRHQRLGLESFGCSEDVRTWLGWAVGAAGMNVVVSGGTSTGKTTLLNSLSHSIDASERIVTIEETAELALGLPHVVRLEARPSNADGAGAVDVRTLVRAALRLRPDRIIIGEARGGEALDLISALNTGHDGSLTTVHANSPEDALGRLETLAALASGPAPARVVRRQLLRAVDLVVHVVRDAGGLRRVETIAEVRESGGVNPVTRNDGSGLVLFGTTERPPRRTRGAGRRALCSR